MKTTGNTIFITGGGSGIGRGLAEAFHHLGNRVIISGRRRAVLEEVARANPGMSTIELDIEKPESIAAAAKRLIAEHPELNVLVNNAGIMKLDNAAAPMDDATVSAIVTTNLLGPIRMSSALIEHLKRQPHAAILNVTSGLAFIPLAMTATYCATKAALHSFTQSMRFVLKGTRVKVIEVAPPYVQTDLMGGKSDPRAMPLADYVAETMHLLATDADEVLVERVKPMRNAAGPNESQFFNAFNERMAHEPPPQ